MFYKYIKINVYVIKQHVGRSVYRDIGNNLYHQEKEIRDIKLR